MLHQQSILVFGARGWLGDRYVRHYRSLGHPVIADGDTRIEIESDVRAVIRGTRPSVVINAAGRAHSAKIPSIDACIASPQAVRDTFLSNAVGPEIVARACQDYGVRLVHLSSGCIFDGPQVFYEHDPPNPVSWYAKTKVDGERLVGMADPSALVLRIRMPISADPHPRNLIAKLAKAKQIVDVVNSVTVVEDLLDYTDLLLNHHVTGIVHAVHPEPLRFRSLMAWYRDMVDPSHTCAWIPKEAFVTADGRSNCVLGTRRELPVASMARSDVAVQRALREYARQRKQAAA